MDEPAFEMRPVIWMLREEDRVVAEWFRMHRHNGEQRLLNPYTPPKPELRRRNRPRSTLIYEITLFGGLASMVGGAAASTVLAFHPVFVNVGMTLFVLGTIALVATLR